MTLDEITLGIKQKTGFSPLVGIVLGTGFGRLADEADVVCRIPYGEIDGFPLSTAEGHKGEYIFGFLEGVPVVMMNGRVHYYEGYSMEQVVMPVRIMAKLGARAVILTNASGGLNRSYHPGTLMCIKDHNSAFVPSPLVGKNDDTLGTRFPDMSKVYDRQLRDILHRVADEQGTEIVDGIYLQITGPAYETPCESAMYAALGADAVGMSTAVEAAALRHMGIRVLGLSCITDMAIDNEDTVTTHEEIQRIADEAGTKLIALVKGTVKEAQNVL
ncbi:MAG: purine-nucleoside phosphorylase [Oscillospiraceae bacterium]|nr:purine-nucleoside phosphorylase [Oscillospiraceae bacterium]